MLKKQPSSISNSKVKTKKRIILKLIIFFTCFFIIQSIFGYLLNPGTYKSDFHPRIRWEDFYKLSKNIDLVFLGSSHAYRSFNPKIFEGKLGVTSFNMGDSSQNPVDSYYVLKETLKRNKPKLVVYEQYFGVCEGPDTDFNSAIYTYDYLKPSINKFECLINEFNIKEFPRALFLSVRYKDNWSKSEVIKQNVSRFFNSIGLAAPAEKKIQQSKTSITGEVYEGLGYVRSDGVVSKKDLTTNNKFNNYKGPIWNKKRLLYDEKAIQLCIANNVKILLVTAPLPPTTLKLIKNYSSIHDKFNAIAKRNGVQYIDYNYINNKSNLFTDKNFKDSDHLNSSGVNILDNDIIKYIKPYLK